MSKKIVVIAGAGPAGLTAALETLKTTDHLPIIYESTEVVGGICRTVEFKGNRMDIGGHRFFSKSDRVLDWWAQVLPLQKFPDGVAPFKVSYQGQSKAIKPNPAGPDPDQTDRVMLVRDRKSSILFLKQFFDYPLTLSRSTLSKLGWGRTMRILSSYLKARLFPIHPEPSLREFFINRFGRELYFTFFKSYTEKVWGVPCKRIPAEWGAQRVKNLSLSKAIQALFQKDDSVGQKKTETSLIQRFLYPKYGPGQMWNEVAMQVEQLGGKIIRNSQVVGLAIQGNQVSKVTVKNAQTGQIHTQDCDYFFSTMPVKELIGCLGEAVPSRVQFIAKGLSYRDFMTVGLLIKNPRRVPPENWIYVQERHVRVGRIQIFNNWSPYLVKDPANLWIGMEYFCNEGDPLWNKNDIEMKALAASELCRLGLADEGSIADGTVIRMAKTYPAYLGTYKDFQIIRDFTDTLENLFLIGRNGMHRYNNQDHSMLTAMMAVQNIKQGLKSKADIWEVNTEEDYHEESQ